jgi:tetratricopeptide (TPR) repeat protein
MIVRDEESHLDACLRSAADLVDELVIVDTGSTDATREIAARWGARVFDFPWRDDFSAARNESLRHARGRWIFWLDADERLPAASRAELRELFASLGDEKTAYLMRAVSPGPNGAPTREVLQAKLFPNDPRVRWEYRIHEQIGLGAQRAGWDLCDAEVTVVHLGYEDPVAVRRKLERNLRIVDLELAEREGNGVLLYHRATTLLDLRRSEEALAAFEACAPLVRDTTLAASIPTLVTRANVLAGRLPAALAEVRDGLARRPGDTTLLFQEAELLAATGALHAAEESLRTQLGRGEQHHRFANIDRTIAAMRVRSLLAEVLLVQDDGSGTYAAEAEVEARRVLAERAAFGQAWMTLGEALVAQGKYAELERVYASLAGSAAMRPAVAALRARAASGGGDHPLALSILGDAMREHPGQPVLLRTHAHVLCACGAYGERLGRTLRESLACNPLCVRTHALSRHATAAGVLASRAGSAA